MCVCVQDTTKIKNAQQHNIADIHHSSYADGFIFILCTRQNFPVLSLASERERRYNVAIIHPMLANNSPTSQILLTT